MNKKFVLYGVVVTLLLCVGMSYAYFTGVISGEGKEIRVSAKELRILFTDNNQLASSEIIPGWKETKTFSVKNESDDIFNYNIVIKDLVNTFVTEGYLQYKITSTSGYNMEGYLDIPKSSSPQDTILAYDIDIPAGVTHEYTVEFVYHDSDEDQSEDMGKIFSGTLYITEGTINPNVKYKVTLEMENATITSINPAETIKNGSVEFNISLNEGYTLDNSVVVCDGNAEGSIEGNKIKIDKVVRDQTCTLTTEKINYNLTMNITGGSLKPANVMVAHGDSGEFTITPSEGYTLESPTVTCTGGASHTLNGNTLTISNVKSNQTCSVSLKKATYTVSVNVTGGSANPTSATIEHGSSGTFVVTANTGYVLENPTITCTGSATHSISGNTLTISSVKEAQTCSVNLKESIKVTLVVNNGAGSTTKTLDTAGANLIFTGVSPNSGYILDSYSCNNGATITLSGTTATVSNISKSQTCTISYVVDTRLKTKILADHTTRPGARPNLNTGIFTSNNTKTLYTASGNQTEGGKTVYYFSGNATDNWVYFAGIYWRIIRINEDESVRLLYVGPDKNTTSGYIGTSGFNETARNPMYIGYMYGSTGSVSNNRKNTTNSMIKGTVDTWYNNTIKNSYHNYVSKTAIYCNDRANEGYTTSSSTSFDYAAYKRLVDAQAPSYKCGNNASGSLFTGTNGANVADKFTGSTITGNGKLTNPVALMTVDEVVFAGGKYNEDAAAYYYYNAAGGSVTGVAWWLTMSPARWFVGSSRIFRLNGSDSPGYLNFVTVGYTSVDMGVRPVLSLKSCVKWKSGDGTSNNPYTVDTLNTACSTAEN